MMLEDGEIKYIGDVNDVVDKYLIETSESGTTDNHWEFAEAPGTDTVKVKSAYVQHAKNILDVKTPFDIITEFWCCEEGFETNVSLNLYDKNSVCVFNVMTDIKPLQKGLYRVTFHIPGNLLNDGYYYINNIFKTKNGIHWVHKKANTFEVVDNREDNERLHGDYLGTWQGVVRPMFIERECERIE
jgi:lipopolysaccharide transport system ATP-binding protein